MAHKIPMFFHIYIASPPFNNLTLVLLNLSLSSHSFSNGFLPTTRHLHFTSANSLPLITETMKLTGAYNRVLSWT